MQREQRVGDPEMMMQLSLSGAQAGLWTALPGYITKYNSAKQIVEVQPTIKLQVQDGKGNWSWVNPPLLIDCPLHFPRGGGWTLTFPIAAGDECLVVFSSRCIDAWWQSGGIQVQAELRMHDLSDGFAFAGFNSVPNVTPNISTDSVELRSRDDTTRVKLGPDSRIRVEAAHVEVHATASYKWDVSGYGVHYSYTAPNIWTIDSYTTPRTVPVPDVVINNALLIHPPEIP